MPLNVRSAVLTAALTATLAPVGTVARAANPMQLTDLGSAFAPPAGVAADSPLSAAGSITVANASGAQHTYALVDLVSGASTSVTLDNGAAHTFGGLLSAHTYSAQQLGGLSSALAVVL